MYLSDILGFIKSSQNQQNINELFFELLVRIYTIILFLMPISMYNPKIHLNAYLTALINTFGVLTILFLK